MRSASAVVRAQNLLPIAPELSQLSVASCSLSVPQVWIVKVSPSDSASAVLAQCHSQGQCHCLHSAVLQLALLLTSHKAHFECRIPGS